MNQTILVGGCLCGRVRYQVQGTPRSSSNCFCRSCRLAAGAQAVAWFVVGLDQYRLVAGEVRTFRSSPQVTRGFCAHCGTSLTYQHDDDPNAIELTTATLDEPERLPPTREIWHSQRISWAPSDAALTHFDEDSASGPATGT